ncbi:MAG TPA: type II CAAX endopeptidase family protein [Bacteroidota bacterium]|nr:type II CAAX endopeptidase family protein [Bacteroidota bacterium]
MTIRSIFLNPDESRLRAGWRIALFILVFALISWGLVAALFQIFSRDIGIRVPLAIPIVTAVGVLAAHWVMTRFVDRRPLASVGLGFHNRTLLELAQGIVLGTAMMSVIFVVLTTAGMAEFQFKTLTTGEAAGMIGICVVEFTLVAWNEELLFRGYLFQTLVEGTNRLIAVCAFALFFAFVHISNPNVTVFSLVNIALAGVWLSIAYFKTRGLWLPIGLHFSWNFFQNNVFSFPVSGLQKSETQLGILRDTGPAWITGGSFGPEGGALATLVLLAGTLAIWYLPIFKISEHTWTGESHSHI